MRIMKKKEIMNCGNWESYGETCASRVDWGSRADVIQERKEVRKYVRSKGKVEVSKMKALRMHINRINKTAMTANGNKSSR